MKVLLESPLFMMFIILLIFIVPFWRIVKRTGHSGWWSLLVFVPLINFIALWTFAFVKWPATDRPQN
jgi:hypothetical protein